MDFQARRDRLRKAFRKAGVDALLVTDFTNVTYLTGFTGDDSYLLVRRDGEVVLSDPRYVTQLGEECPGLDLQIRPPGVSMLQAVLRVVRPARIARLGVEGDSMTVGLHDRLVEKLPKAEIVATSGLVEQLRQIKDADEIERIRLAVWQAEKAFAVLRSTLRPEMTEKEAADELEHQFRLFGAKNAAFPSIVAVGPRGALPHAVPTEKRIGDDDFVLIDWGANEGLYCSDLTRVLVTGKISPRNSSRFTGLYWKPKSGRLPPFGPALWHPGRQRRPRLHYKSWFRPPVSHGLGHGVGMFVREDPRWPSRTKPSSGRAWS